MSAERNSTPSNIWEALRRLLNCNRTQLAERLGVNRRTLARWEAGEAGDDAYRRASALLISTLAAAEGADALAQWRLNLDNLATVGGRR